MDTDYESAHTVNLGEENSSSGTQTNNPSITSPALYQQTIPAPHFPEMAHVIVVFFLKQAVCKMQLA